MDVTELITTLVELSEQLHSGLVEFQKAVAGSAQGAPEEAPPEATPAG